MPRPQPNEGKMLELLLKALGDESRLRTVWLLAEREYNVGELATTLGLTEPTISHHLTKLREVSLVNMRADGNNRYYRLNPATMQQFKDFVSRFEQIRYLEPVAPNDTSWMDALELTDEERTILENCTYNGRIKQVPMGKKVHVVLRWIATHFKAGRTYKEREVNEIIGRFNEDISGLRRDMVDSGYLKREKNGSAYWLAEEQPAR